MKALSQGRGKFNLKFVFRSDAIHKVHTLVSYKGSSVGP